MNAQDSPKHVPELPILLLDNCKCHYDFDAAIGYIFYNGQITPQITDSVYEWMGEILTSLPEGHRVRGAIFDFTAVERTSASNISTANTRGKNFREEHAAVVTKIPTALVVKSLYQELLVETMMKLARHSLNNTESHVRLVKSQDEAKTFIDSWQE